MGYRCLRRYRGEFFIYVGEEPLPNGVKPASVDDEFFHLLEREWQLLQLVTLPNWELCWDRLYIFRRGSAVALDHAASAPCADAPTDGQVS